MQNGELTVEANFYTSKPRRNYYHHRGSQSAEEATEKKGNEQQTSEHQASLTRQRDNPIASPVNRDLESSRKKEKKKMRERDGGWDQKNYLKMTKKFSFQSQRENEAGIRPKNREK